jgi:3-oxoacyl-[acyl-carrier protein] reductase
MNPFDLTGRTALVTGASGGIGSAIARQLASLGARVALSGTRREALDALSADLPGSVVLPTDLSDGAAVDALVPSAVEALGGLDILVNNAGLTRDNLALRMKDADWDAVIAVNLTAAFRLARAACKPMMKARRGRIISVSSVVARMGNAGQANYAASKAGLEGLTRALAHELAPRNITVNAVAPGFITSAMTDALNETQRGAMFERIPLARFGTPEDVAAAVAWLASEAGGYVTGQVVAINGGLDM